MRPAFKVVLVFFLLVFLLSPNLLFQLTTHSENIHAVYAQGYGEAEAQGAAAAGNPAGALAAANAAREAAA
jgi:hypothetical protein